MDVLFAAAWRKVGGRVAGAAQHPLGREQTLDADRPAGVDSGSADAHFGSFCIQTIVTYSFRYFNRAQNLTETEAIAIGESGARVVKHARAVHHPQKLFSFFPCFEFDV